ncbi:MAG: NAD-dependent dehydratase [Nitrospinae bacterium CG11_big_fil_rev_8_21_14_0_20_56_8]|nr:MAG: NAD-dependent dehydratase [Nitrospinae bacterium CG11_big_fil_rev_8_21_14_0_20_56_8]
MLILVTGAGGFIGHCLVKKLKADGETVIAADWKYPEFERSPADRFFNVDLRYKEETEAIFRSCGQFDEVYNLAANMGGMGFIENYRALIMRDSVLISTNVLEAARKYQARRFFYSSSACAYNTELQKDLNNPALSEDMAYPAMPEAGYGWEKLFSELLCQYFREDYGLVTRVARYHNVYGPNGTWRGGREKAPAAMCRKVILTASKGEIEIWGDGKQQRSFMFIDDCVEGTLKIMRGDYPHPLNLGSDELVEINHLADIAMSFEKKHLTKKYIEGPLGVRGRNSDNSLIQKVLGWRPSISLNTGLEKTYFWIKGEIETLRAQGVGLEASSEIPEVTDKRYVG